MEVIWAPLVALIIMGVPALAVFSLILIFFGPSKDEEIIRRRNERTNSK